ncbi:MAG: TIGR02466 family protein [Alphaproteobacteria bacterium]|nr:TIGR02466 family protein [Alphaproteobacteria bacterium]MCZ6494987.1 TIGR02466 family protein [Alphaproteobacteria bacterium]MCZ6740796.1 TIGR02466 family protein [Alphaproteobacteria bacterium]MCZ6814607.1 TIGR02466 family protein [Alphaproteobacteria bacterium]
MPETKITLEEHLRWLFPTPVVAHPWEGSEAINEELRALILKTEHSPHPDMRNVVGGWATAKDFFSWDAECVRELWRHIETLVATVVKGTSKLSAAESADLGFEAWANVLRHGGYHRPHTHYNCYWSGVYYVSVGEPNTDVPWNGWLELFDPRSATGAIGLRGNVYQAPCLIEPKPGLTILFPGWVKHMVHPFQGKSERISVSFNLLGG